MYAQAALELGSALVKFYSKDDVSKYIRGLIENYQKQIDYQGDRLGALLRVNPQQPAPANPQKGEKPEKVKESKLKTTSKGWVKMGSMFFNTSDPTAGSMEVIYTLHEEMKQKLGRTAEALKSFEEASGTIIPEGAAYFLYLRNGVPERLVVDVMQRKASTFSFHGKFKIV